MANGKPYLTRLSPEQQAALESYLAAHPGKTFSEVFRCGMLTEIGREDLIDTMRGRGCPRKEAV